MNVTIDTAELTAIANALGFSDRRMRAVAASSLTAAVRDADRAWRGQLQGRIDRPTPATRSASVVERATADKLTATVKLKDQPAGGQGTAAQDWLVTLERGGQRALKRFELVLQRAGAMPAGYRAVPGSAAKRDAYGNVARGQFIAVLNQLGGAQLTRGYARTISANPTRRAASAARSGRQYVAITQRGPGGLPMGIYERTAAARNAATIRGTLRGLRPVFVFTRGTKYRKQLDLVDQGTQIATAALPGYARLYLQQHIDRVTAARA